MKWTYQIYQLSTDRNTTEIVQALDDLGEDGWEAVASWIAKNQISFLLKKPK
jgi:hypothetical protein